MKITFHETEPKEPKPGDAWYETFDYDPESIAEQHRGKRPIRVQLNADTSFMIYSRMFNKEQGWHGDGWSVSGEPNNLTLSPSVNFPERWHGFIKNGELVNA